MGEVAGKTDEPRIAAKLGETCQRLSFEWKTLRLLVGDHLQPMLDATEISIGPGKIFDRFLVDPLVGAQLLQHVEGARPAHLGTSSAKNELLRLDEKLDFANA